MMRTARILLALWFGFAFTSLAQNDSLDIFGGLPIVTDAPANAVRDYVSAPKSKPTGRTLSEDVVQDSIKSFRFSTNQFAVRWTYTEAGAKKALASWEANPSRQGTMSPEWKAGWLKWRTDKGFFKSEEAAQAFMASLKKK